MISLRFVNLTRINPDKAVVVPQADPLLIAGSNQSMPSTLHYYPELHPSSILPH